MIFRCVNALAIALVSALAFSSVAFAVDSEEVDKLNAESLRLMKAGEDDKALIEIDKALKKQRAPMMVKRKAECLVNLGRPQEALALAKEAEKLEPNNAQMHETLCAVYDALRMPAEALKELNMAVTMKPGDRGFRASREKLYERSHEYAKAIEDLNLVIKTSDAVNRAKPLERRANCYLLLKDYPKAIADLTGALSGSVGRSDLMRLRAQAYEKLGNHAAAQKDIKAAEEMDGDFEPPDTMGNRK